MASIIKSVRDLEVYRIAFEAAMKIFKISKSFPKEEMYSLTDQIRRSSRSVCTNLSEGWRKRRYKAVFINKLSDAGQESAETQTWLEFALRCEYIDNSTFLDLDETYEHSFVCMFCVHRPSEAIVPLPSVAIYPFCLHSAAVFLLCVYVLRPSS